MGRITEIETASPIPAAKRKTVCPVCPGVSESDNCLEGSHHAPGSEVGKSPRRGILSRAPHPQDGEPKPELPPDYRSHRACIVRPNGSRLSCGALKNDSFP